MQSTLFHIRQICHLLPFQNFLFVAACRHFCTPRKSQGENSAFCITKYFGQFLLLLTFCRHLHPTKTFMGPSCPVDSVSLPASGSLNSCNICRDSLSFSLLHLLNWICYLLSCITLLLHYESLTHSRRSINIHSSSLTY